MINKMFRLYLWLFGCFLGSIFVSGDIYLHNPRGSNNRLDEQGRNRNNERRMFDSQNNNRGGYNVANLYYFTESILQIEWTNQHSCNSGNANCEIILQYMCSDNIRDGANTDTIPEVNEQCNENDCNRDFRYGMNEDNQYYQSCNRRSRNKGLFVADQNLKGQTARFTRQNPGGTRYGYECPEERDYYPYWHPTSWIDIAVLTNDPKRCSYFQSESENVKSRWYCIVPNTYRGIIPISKLECEKIPQANWTESTAHNVDPPICRETQFTRDNHLGNTIGGNAPTFDWKLPKKAHEHCVFRIRYNISTNDYDPLETYQGSNLNLSSKMGLSAEEAKRRGYEFKNNPKVKIFSDLDISLNLAINTAQYGRVFEDRSHVFAIRTRQVETDKKIYNLNVRGKRGNIVQVYPSVEYDFVPNKLEISKNDYIHIQWTGSNRNPLNNDGQGLPGTDRSNILLLENRNFSIENDFNRFAPLNVYGNLVVNYPAKISNSSFLGFSKSDMIKLALLQDNQFGGSLDQLDDAGTYFDLGVRKVTSSGVYNYMCTRNNNFSNRDQKGVIISYENEFISEYFGWNGGVLEFSFGQIEIPQGALQNLNNFKVTLKTKSQVAGTQLEEKVLKPNKLDDTNMATDLVIIDPIVSAIKLPLKFKLKLKRALGNMETHTLFRINNHIITKIDSNAKDKELTFESDQTGIYVVKYERNYSVLIGTLVAVGVALLLIGAILIFLYNNPKYLKSLRYRANNAKRSFNDQL